MKSLDVGLKALDGSNVSLRSLLSGGRPLLLVFLRHLS
jgi:hypothetical protein